MFNRSLSQWQDLLDDRLLEKVGDEEIAHEIWGLVEDLEEALSHVEMWKTTAGSWEQKAKDMAEALEQQRNDHVKSHRGMIERLERYETIIDMMCGRVEPMVDQLSRSIRDDLLDASPERIEEMAHATYREFTKGYGLKDEWEQESAASREGIIRTIEVILRILARSLAASAPTPGVFP